VTVAEDGIEDGQKLTHAGDACDFGGSPGLNETLVEDADGRVPSGSADDRHEQRVPNRGAAAHDPAPAAHRTAVAVDGRNPNQGCDAPSVEQAELGQLSDQRPRGDWTNARDRGEQVLGLSPRRGTTDCAFEVPIDPTQLVLQLGQMAFKTALERSIVGLSLAVGLGLDHVDDLASACDQIGQRPHLRIGYCSGFWPDAFSEQCNHFGIEPIGLR
jgi:hypothetical protein